MNKFMKILVFSCLVCVLFLVNTSSIMGSEKGIIEPQSTNIEEKF